MGNVPLSSPTVAAGVAAAPSRLDPRRRRILFEHVEAYLFVLPAVILVGVFDVLPGVAAFLMSLTRWGVIFERFAGLENYRAILDPAGTRFEQFINALGVTAWYVLLTVPVEIVLALVIAVVLYQ